MPKAKVHKVLAYRKCQQCRKDRQKCTPEGRSWPGRRCDRCQRYNYACSANKAKNEETAPSNLGSSTRHDVESRALAPHYSPEARCLQKLGDCHRMLTIAESLCSLNFIYSAVQESRIRELINECAEDITVQAQTHQAQGKYKDAEYLYRQMEAASAPLESPHDSLLKPEPDMVLIYEKLGNLPAAETLQQSRLLFLMRPELGSDYAIISREAENLFRLYTLFLARVKDLNVMSTSEILLTIFYRIAILGCSLLNALLFKSELWTPYNHDPCLHIAIGVQSTEMIRGLISIGVDVNNSGDDWDSPLFSAVRYGYLDGLKLLLDNNVDVGARSAGWGRTALHEAICRDPEGKNEIIYCLIKAGVDVNAQDMSGRNALQLAVDWGPEPDEKLVRRFIEAGVNIEAKDLDKKTVLHLAVRRRYLTTVQLLLQEGANVEVYGSVEETPLFYAVRYAHESMASLLLGHDVNTEAQDLYGYTPLHLAARLRKVGMVETLLKGGASVAARNYLGQTPVDIARLNVIGGSEYDQRLLNILLEHVN